MQKINLSNGNCGPPLEWIQILLAAEKRWQFYLKCTEWRNRKKCNIGIQIMDESGFAQELFQAHTWKIWLYNQLLLLRKSERNMPEMLSTQRPILTGHLISSYLWLWEEEEFGHKGGMGKFPLFVHLFKCMALMKRFIIIRAPIPNWEREKDGPTNDELDDSLMRLTLKFKLKLCTSAICSQSIRSKRWTTEREF